MTFLKSKMCLAFEKQSLISSAAVQEETGCPVTIHPGRHPTAPEEILRIYQEAGGRTERLVMGHLDRKPFICIKRILYTGMVCKLNCVMIFEPIVDFKTEIFFD